MVDTLIKSEVFLDDLYNMFDDKILQSSMKSDSTLLGPQYSEIDDGAFPK